MFKPPIWDSRFSWQWILKLWSSRAWYHVVGRRLPILWRDLLASIFTVEELRNQICYFVDGGDMFLWKFGSRVWNCVTSYPRSREIGIDYLSWLLPQGCHVDTLNRAHLAFFDYLDWGFIHAFSLSYQANVRVERAKTGHGPHSSHVRRLNFSMINLLWNLNVSILGSNPRKPFSQSYAPA
jgi:hypothetical protein